MDGFDSAGTPTSSASPSPALMAGSQDFDDACSICLEPFTADDPATITTCKHEYHLQCILDWSQRSKECPICWQLLVLKDPASQELLAAMGIERSSRSRRCPSDSSSFPRIPLEDFEFHDVPPYADDSDFDERIMQHLTAAAMARAHHFSRREWRRSSGMSHSEILVFPTHSNESDEPQSRAANLIGNQGTHCFVSCENGSPAILLSPATDGRPTSMPSSHASMDSDIGDNSQTATPRSVANQASPGSPRRLRSSELFSFSDSLKAKVSAASSRYKESISKSARGLKEKLLSRNGSVKELSKEVQREVTAGVARMMERLDPSSKRSGGYSSFSGGNEGTSESSPRTPVNHLTDSPNGSDERTTLVSSSNATSHTSEAHSSGSELNFGLTHVQGAL